LRVFSLMRSLMRLTPANRYFCAGLKSSSMWRAISIAWTDSGTMYGGMSVGRLRFLRVSILRCLSDMTGMIHNPRSRSN